jgi:glycosyltransferase involved in cell wall biosynthesis
MQKKALMACSNYWTSPFQVGDHHIARSLVRLGWDVAFVSAPISPPHLFKKSDLLQRYAIYQNGGEKFLDDHLWAYIPGALLVPFKAPILDSKWLHYNWWHFSLPNIIGKIKENGFGKVDLLYLGSILQPFLLDEIEFTKSVFRVMDHLPSFPSTSSATNEIQMEIARRVDITVYSARSLEPYIKNLHPTRSVYMPNGVNYSHFADDKKEFPPEYSTISGPIAIYVGAMDVWFDYELIAFAATQLPGIAFVLIGPDDLARTKLPELSNLHILGQREYKDIPKYLFHADVGLIPFSVKKYPQMINHVHPLKLYEYMACGLPVVTTSWEELEKINSPAILSNSPDEFVNNIAWAVTHHENSEERINFAKQADWMKRVSSLVLELDL